MPERYRAARRGADGRLAPRPLLGLRDDRGPLLPALGARLLAVVRAVETAYAAAISARVRPDRLAVATRAQGVVLVAVFAAACSRGGVRAHGRPPARLLARLARPPRRRVAAAVAPGVFGAYAGRSRGGYPLEASLRLVYYHLAYTAVDGRGRAGRGARRPARPGGSAVARRARRPRAALRDRRRRRPRRRAGRTLLGPVRPASPRTRPRVAAGTALPRLLPLARTRRASAPARHVAHGRRRARDHRGAPWNTLVSDEALPDTMGIALVHRHIWGVATGRLPRRRRRRRCCSGSASGLLACLRARALIAIVLGTLVVTSCSLRTRSLGEGALRRRPRWSAHRQTGCSGPSTHPVTYVFNGDLGSWNVIWQQRFWNPRHRRPWWRSAPFTVPGPALGTASSCRRPMGGCRSTRGTSSRTTRSTFVGTPVAHQDRGDEEYGLTLWRLRRACLGWRRSSPASSRTATSSAPPA